MKSSNNKDQKIVVSKNGPYLISGNLPLQKDIAVPDEEGIPLKWEKGQKYPDKESYALCRCGGSKNKPFCDGSHIKNGFNGTETANKEKYLDKAETTKGPDLDLTNAEEFCSIARFCHRAGDVWNLTERSDDPGSKKTAIEESCNCPSGRLVAWDKKTGKPIEPKYERSISIIEDAPQKVSGPIWVKGGVPVESSDETQYEVRNRATLCRCGGSLNKPFCDGAHCRIRFSDGDPSLGE